jgi:cation:H+ antiporter
VGNLVGSCIINVFLVLSAAILIGGMRIGTTKTQRNIWVMIAVTGLFSWLWWRGWSVTAGIILVTVAVGFSLVETIWGVEGRKLEDRNQLKKIKPGKGKWGFLTVLGAGGLVTGGMMTVLAVEKIALATGLSQTFLGLTLTAAATSLPELLVTMKSEEEKEEKVALGNVIGSNIYNLALIGGLMAFFGRPSGTNVGGWEFLWLSAGIMWLVVSGFKGKVVPRWVGGGLLVLFAVYVWTLIG